MQTTVPAALNTVEPTPDPFLAPSDYLMALARLGDYLARTREPPPGHTVLWRGMVRLMDIELSYELAREDVGN